MKKSLLIMSLALTVATINGQAPERPFCATDEMYFESIRENPQFLKNHQDLEDFTRQFVNQYQAQHRSAQPVNTINTPPTYVIPVVFHVLHEYGAENISDAQIYNCIENMNADYRKLNADTINTLPIFKSIAADCSIEFRLATIDPSGNCTNGIDRIYTSKTNSANNNSKLNSWTGNYLNIWTAKSLENTGAAAYSHFPGTVSLSQEGVMARHDYIGTIGTGGPGGLHTISHEVGHFLNLAHTWGTTNSPGVSCGDDFVQDTPETQGWTSCNLSGSVCNPPVVENVQNFMEYSYCDNMFTNGQKTRMYAALNSAIGARSSLWSANNLIATGTSTPNPVSQCAPIADFWTTQQSVCVGRSVNFKDYSWNARPTSWSWSFPGGTPSTSTDSMPVVVYNTPGIYDVTLVVTNANGSDNLVRNGFIRVSGTTGIQGVYTEPFTTIAAITANDAWLYNPDAGSTTWSFWSNAGANGTPSCIRINNYSNTAGQIDEWISPSFDVSNLTGASMKFYVANAQRNSTSNDLLRVFTSTNCGENWTNKYNKNK
ncbi:MAG: M43 family zinc metalloprotease [Bacteroidota bacterium]